jgi:hypothetical protein
MCVLMFCEAVIAVGFGAAHASIIRSLAVSSVDPLKHGTYFEAANIRLTTHGLRWTGEVLAAIEMMSSIGSFLSPLVMGGIFTA